MKEPDKTDFPIDAVIPWVDGNDPAYRKKINEWLELQGEGVKLDSPTRYVSIGEINYCVKSILKYASFIRTIYIVTDNQVPEIYRELSHLNNGGRKKIVIVDHKQIFRGFEHFLPTFNSVSIETLSPRIPGLAEHFVYFNDDMILIKKIKPTDWFINGIPVIRGKWKLIPSRNPVKIAASSIRRLAGRPDYNFRPGYGRIQVNAALVTGYKRRYLRIHHTPNPIRCSTVNKYLEENPDVLETNIKYRTRHYSQSLFQSIANNLEMKTGRPAIIKDYQLLYLPSYRSPLWYIKLKLKIASMRRNILFANFQSLELAGQDKIDAIFTWLDGLPG